MRECRSAVLADNTVTTADIADGTIAIGDISAAAQTALTGGYSGRTGASWTAT